MTDFVLPKGIDQETYDKAKVIIVSGFEAKQDADTIKSALFSDGIPFSKLARVFNSITVAEGLVIDTKVVKEHITEALSQKEFTFEETYNELLGFGNALVENIEGATIGKVMSLIKAHFIENENTMPKKPSGQKTGRMGLISKTLVNLFADNKEATELDCKNSLIGVVKTEKNAEDYARSYHRMLYAAANGLNADEVIAKFANASN